MVSRFFCLRVYTLTCASSCALFKKGDKMLRLDEHPSVIKFRERAETKEPSSADSTLQAEWLRGLCLTSGADDLGFVELSRKALLNEREDMLNLLPGAKSIIAIACRINRDNIRTPAHSIANTEFQVSVNNIESVAHRVVGGLNAIAVRAVSISGLFPMEMDRWPGKLWDLSLKPLAVEAGLGRIGHNRMVIHPEFGAFMYLSAVIIDREVTAYNRPIEYNPCIKCKLCAATCPTGAIAPDGHFDFVSCLTHNYREKLSGFSDWVETIAGSKNSLDYRKKISDSETVSMWQSLVTGGNTKCDQCMAVCPAGEDVIGPYLEKRTNFLKEVVKPLQMKKEKVYVIADSDAEEYVRRRFANKKARVVSKGQLRPTTINGFLETLPLIFQRGRSEGIDAAYHFTFTGEEEAKATVIIRDKKITVSEGHTGDPDLRVMADSKIWLKFLARERNILLALISRKIRVKGPLKLLKDFGRCFPS